MLGFDDYGAIGDRLDDVLAGRPLVPHTPRDRRTLLPISPVERTAVTTAADAPAIPGHDWLRRRRLASGPSAALKLASGCDRRCAFCAIPTFRGAFVSRPAAEVLGEARMAGVAGRHRAGARQRELHLLRQGPRRPAVAGEAAAAARRGRGPRPRARRLPAAGRAAARPARGHRGHGRGRAVLRPLLPALLAVRCCAGCAASAARDDFLQLIERARALAPGAGFRTNVILGFPGRPRTTSPSSSASSPRAAWTRSASSATPTRRAPRRWG